MQLVKFILFYCIANKLSLHLCRSSKWGADILNERAFLILSYVEIWTISISKNDRQERSR